MESGGGKIRREVKFGNKFLKSTENTRTVLKKQSIPGSQQMSGNYTRVVKIQPEVCEWLSKKKRKTDLRNVGDIFRKGIKD